MTRPFTVQIQHGKPPPTHRLHNSPVECFRLINAIKQLSKPSDHFFITRELIPPPEREQYEARISEGQSEYVALKCVQRYLNRRFINWKPRAKCHMSLEDPPRLFVTLREKGDKK